MPITAFGYPPPIISIPRGKGEVPSKIPNTAPPGDHKIWGLNLFFMKKGRVRFIIILPSSAPYLNGIFRQRYDHRLRDPSPVAPRQKHVSHCEFSILFLVEIFYFYTFQGIELLSYSRPTIHGSFCIGLNNPAASLNSPYFAGVSLCSF